MELQCLITLVENFICLRNRFFLSLNPFSFKQAFSVSLLFIFYVIGYAQTPLPIIINDTIYSASRSDSLRNSEIRSKGINHIIDSNQYNEDLECNETSGSSYSTSVESHWYGAEASYNFIGDHEFSNFVGSAPIKIGGFDIGKIEDFLIYFTGNIANIITNKSENPDKSANQIAQNNRGISLGISPIYILNEFNIGQNQAYIRAFGNAFFKYHVFQVDSSATEMVYSESIELPQFGLNLGIELEGLTLVNDNKPSTFYLFFYSTRFEKEKFYQVVGRCGNNISGFEAGLILPFSGIPVGFIAKYNNSNQFKGNFSVGLVIQN